MKIRNDFVTNSSSYSSCVIRIDNPVLYEIFSKYKGQGGTDDMCKNGLALYRINDENAGIEAAPRTNEDVLNNLITLIHNTMDMTEKEFEDSELLRELKERREEISNAYREISWYVSLDYNNEDPTPSAHGKKVYKWPKRSSEPLDLEASGSNNNPELFNYDTIDQYSSSFYADILDDLNVWNIKDQKYKVCVDGVEITVNMRLKALMSKIKDGYYDYIMGKDKDWFLYDPHILRDYKNAGGNCVLGEVPELSINLIRHRVLMYIKILTLLADERVARLIAESAKKKKDKTLYINRTLPVAALAVADFRGACFGVQAKSTKANVIELKATDFDFNTSDHPEHLIVMTNMFNAIKTDVNERNGGSQ